MKSKRPCEKDLAMAAVSYLTAYTDPDEWAEEHGRLPGPCHDWPWARKEWKPSKDPIENLKKASRLIEEEIERLLKSRETQRRAKQLGISL